MHPENSFITLTYDNDHVPTSYSVDKRPFQLFMKRLRKSLGSQLVRFFACGEYGDEGLRPHYHALIFNHAFPDRKLHAVRNGRRYYKSDALNALWPFGQLNEVTDVTYQSAGYVARYTMKKVNGDGADDHYYRRSPMDGNYYRVAEEFSLGSRRPGIGTSWLQKFKADYFPSDFVVVDGRKKKPPRFYLNKLKEDEQQQIKRARKRQSLKHRDNNTKERLAVREVVQRSRLSRLKRSL